MSMNIYVGPKMAPWQSPTEVTDRVLAECRGGSFIEQDLSALDLLETWVLETCVKQLAGKDARNPFLIEQQAESVRTIKAQVDDLREFVRRAGGARRQVTRG